MCSYMSSVITQTCGCAEEDVGQAGELGAGVAGAGGVGRRVEDEPLGAGRDRRLKGLRGDLEAALQLSRHHDGGAAGERHHVGVADPVGGGDDHLVAGVHGGEERVEEHLLAAGRDDDLVGGVVEAVLAGELGGDGAAELGDALGGGVAGAAGVDGGLGGGADVGGGVEVGLAGRKRDDVAALGLELERAGGDGDGRRGLDAREGVGEEGHGALRGCGRDLNTGGPCLRLRPRAEQGAGLSFARDAVRDARKPAAPPAGAELAPRHPRDGPDPRPLRGRAPRRAFTRPSRSI